MEPKAVVVEWRRDPRLDQCKQQEMELNPKIFVKENSTIEFDFNIHVVLQDFRGDDVLSTLLMGGKEKLRRI